MLSIQLPRLGSLAKTCIDELKGNGFALLQNFVSRDELSVLKNEVQKLLENLPKPKDRVKFDPTTPEQQQVRFNSCNEIDYFFKPNALGYNGELLMKPDVGIKIIGYCLHKNKVLREQIFNSKVRNIFKEIGYENPVVVQSLLHFTGKSPAAPVHQDTTYMICDPAKIVGLFVALDDTDTGNGCPWFLSGSHKTGPQRLMKRNPKSDKKDDIMFDKPPININTENFEPVQCAAGNK
ncbi:phytanoyl-CoA dioxygenase 1 [Agrilus planipennis]|uniref:Phytanoyl-CoA dioxygenase 1 n=1 Tax=Agrilus planipennis TaxID=224129 RepID=A0A7F5R7R5_AGRPL|nr:phytanoyl-CoA dioxygenase 1 [Agrilus planipennis]